MMRWMMALCLAWFAVGVSASEDPRAAVEPLFQAREAFFSDVEKFQKGELTEDQLVTRIAEQFSPLLDDRKLALRVMGRFAREASAEERVAFTKRLETSLVDAYAKGLAAYGGEQLVLPEEAVILKPGRALVEAQLETPGRDPLPIQFALGYEENRGWRVENVVVAGINLGLTLRNQFADLVKTTGSVSGAIDAWSFEAVDAQ